MKRKLFIWIAVLCLLATSILPAHAATSRLDDDAGLLSLSEEKEIAELLDEISQRHEMDIVVVTADSLDGLSPMEYADDYYDYGGYGEDGILLLVSIADNDWYVSTAGYGITAITDAGLTYMSKRFVPYLSEGEYGKAFETFAQLCDEFITQAKTGDPYDTHNLPKDPFAAGVNLVIALVIGLVVALIATGIMKGKLKTVRQQAKADDYVEKGSMRLDYSRDLFLYTHLDRREKPKSSSGSSTHISSSGTTHGGGGGKF
ncbi:MAG: TPM domain-containing protein [Oscillospiraceae bacterium]|nr:TPM domain-containing protein [Oscillospiraceae bacterium]